MKIWALNSTSNAVFFNAIITWIYSYVTIVTLIYLTINIQEPFDYTAAMLVVQFTCCRIASISHLYSNTK